MTNVSEVGVTGTSSEPLWRIVGRAVAQAPEKSRRTVRLGLLVFGLMVGLQIWDVAGRSGPPVVAELLGSIAGFTGGWLVILALVLHEISKSSATAPREGQPSLPPQVLLALPAIAFAGGVLLAFSIANYVLRGVLGASPWAVAAMSAILFAVLILGARTVTTTTRFLYQSAQEQARAAARAEAQAVEAQLAALQSQMQPHFLFNALNTVASLVRTDPRRAERTVENLADVLRHTLRRSRVPLHPLREELELLESYLALEQERLGDRLRVVWSIAPDTRELQVPPLTLQPLVENALKHAIGSRIEGGTLRVGSALEGSVLRLTVEDDGEGFPSDARDGIGLGNLRQRLATQFGSRALLRVEPASGARIVVRIPAFAPATAGKPAHAEATADKPAHADATAGKPARA